jgi:hypothetical protein
MGVFDHRQGQSCKRVTKGRVVRHHDHNRVQAGLQETARGFPNKELTPVRLEQFLATESSR